MADTQELMTSSPSGTNINTTYLDDGGGEEPMTVARYIWIFTLPLIFIIGVFGNILTIIVMRRKRMSGTASSLYLTFMAIADTAVLVTGVIPEWLYQTGICNLAELHQWVCKIIRFLFYGTGDFAIWILVAFTCDRFIAVCFPLKKQEYCTSRRAKLACVIVLSVAVIKNIHVFWTRGVVYDGDGQVVENCGKPEPFTDFEKKVRPWIVLALVSLGPFCVILICNIMIIKELFFSQRMRKAMISDTSKAFTQTTAMCLSTSIAFLVLITPSIVLLIGKPYWTDKEKPNVSYEIAKAVNNGLMYLNHSINFFLYCMTGGRFRHELVLMFKCKRKHHNGMSSPDCKMKSSLSSHTQSAKFSSLPCTPKSDGRSKKLSPAITLNGDVITETVT